MILRPAFAAGRGTSTPAVVRAAWDQRPRSVAMFTTAADVDAVIGAVDEIVRAGAPA